MSLLDQFNADAASVPASSPSGGSSLADQFAQDSASVQPQTVSQPRATAKPSRSLLGDGASGTIGATIVGGLKGAWDTLVEGPAQFLANAAADAFPGSKYLQDQKRIANEGVNVRGDTYRKIVAGHEAAGDVGQVVGSVAGSVALPATRVTAATLPGRILQAGKAGALVAAAQPVENANTNLSDLLSGADGKNYYLEKSKQAAVGAAGGVIGQPVVEGAGALLSGLAGKITPTVKAAERAVSGATPIDQAIPNASPELKAKIAQASPQLQSYVQDVADKGGKIDPQALSRHLEADSLPVPVQLTAGQASGDPALISTERNMRAKNPDIVQRFNDQAAQLKQNFDVMRNQVAPDVDAPNNFSAGERVISSLQSIDEAMKQRTASLYKSLEDANGGNLPIDGAQFANTAFRSLDDKMKAAFLPPQIQGILNKFSSGQQPMTFENFENLRTILSAEQRAAERSGNGNVAQAVGIVHDSLLSTPISSDVKGVKDLADQARASAKQRFDLMRNIPAYKAVAEGSVEPDKFFGKYVFGSSDQASAKNVQKLFALVGDDPSATQALKAGGINHLAEISGSNGGNVGQSNFNKALRNQQQKLAAIYSPHELETLNTLGRVSRYVQEQPAGSWVNNSNTFVAQMGDAAGGLAAHAVDKAMGVPVGSAARYVIGGAVEGKANASKLKDILKPGAGASTQPEIDRWLKNKLPPYGGAAGGALLPWILPSGN